MKLGSRNFKDTAFRWICKTLTYFCVSILVVLLIHIVSDGSDLFSKNLFTNLQSRFVHKAGMKSGIFGTIWLIGLTALFSIPIGVGTAVYLEEYAKPGKLLRFIRVNISNLAGVPSIVYGLLGLAVFVRTLGLNRSLLSGSLTLSLLIMPVIIVASSESLKAVPKSLREAAFALGAPKWRVVFGQVVPAAAPGMMTGVILALSRAIGETAPLIIVGALTYINYVPEGPMDEFTALPLQIYGWAGRPQEKYHHLAASGIILLLSIMFIFNMIAVFIRQRTQKRMGV